jgi:hypothetical protein
LEALAFGRLWAATTGIVARHRELLLPLAGAFFFLPQLLFGWRVGERTPAELFAADRWLGDALVLALVAAGSLVGQLVVARIAAEDGTRGDTLGDVLAQAATLLLPALAASLIQSIGVAFGLLAFILPGLWLLSRLILVVPVIAVEATDPVVALKRSWALTTGQSLRILGMLALLILGFLLLSLAVEGLGSALGVVSTVATGRPASGWGIGRWLLEILRAGLSAALGLYFMVFVARLYAVLRVTA